MNIVQIGINKFKNQICLEKSVKKIQICFVLMLFETSELIENVLSLADLTKMSTIVLLYQVSLFSWAPP